MILCLLETVRHEVHGLILGDRIFLKCCFWRIEWSNLRFIRQAIFQFAERRQQASSVSFQFSILTTESKLDSEPVALSSIQSIPVVIEYSMGLHCVISNRNSAHEIEKNLNLRKRFFAILSDTIVLSASELVRIQL